MSEIHLPWLDPDKLDFPPVEQALKEPNGLLAVGGDLSPERLIKAYENGIFPWYDKDQPILWWCPNPRAVIFLNELKISRSLNKSIKNKNYKVTFNKDFFSVIEACAQKRSYTNDTWISADIKKSYGTLHQKGFAHSVECWQEDKLVGGLYGICIGKMFFGESMFSRSSDASKVCLAHLTKRLLKHDFEIIDCQIPNDHLKSLGSRSIGMSEFKAYLQRLTKLTNKSDIWYNIEEN